MPLIKVSSKSQIVLPAKIRKQLAIKPGDILEIKAENMLSLFEKLPLFCGTFGTVCFSDLPHP